MVLATLGGGVALGLAGCSRAVQVTPPPAAGSPGCAAVASAWPTRVAGLERGEASTDSPAVAVWGEGGSAIVARCGVDPPAPTTDDCLDIDGVDWVVRRLDDGAAFVTYGRTPAVEVLVPAAHAPEPLVMGDFAAAGKAVPQGPRSCA